jgi:hypothetical protein
MGASRKQAESGTVTWDRAFGNKLAADVSLRTGFSGIIRVRENNDVLAPVDFDSADRKEFSNFIKQAQKSS